MDFGDEENVQARRKVLEIRRTCTFGRRNGYWKDYNLPSICRAHGTGAEHPQLSPTHRDRFVFGIELL